MDDIKILLFILFAIISFVSRAMKKKKKQQQASSQGDANSTQKEVSFEDLLKEFTQGRVDTEEQEEKTIYKEPEPKEKLIWQGSDEEAASVYERSIRDAEDRVTYSETEKGHDHHLKRFAVFEEEQEDHFLQDLRAELEDESTMKKAVIYKEILDRKHF